VEDGNSAAGDNYSNSNEADSVDKDEIFQEALRMVRARKAEEQQPIKHQQLNSGAPSGKRKQQGPTVLYFEIVFSVLTGCPVNLSALQIDRQ
jgi:hypothetical protein